MRIRALLLVWRRWRPALIRVLRAFLCTFALTCLGGCCINIDGAVLARAISESARQPLAEAYGQRDDDLLAAIDRAMDWLESAEAATWYEEADYDERRYLVLFTNARLRRHLVEADSADDFVERVYDDGLFAWPLGVTFTGYFAPEHDASRVRTDRFNVPLYRLPAELSQDRDATWRTRSEIEDQQLLAGRELVWLDDPLDAYLIHINGSARLRLTDGSVMHVAHSATNNLQYTSIGRLMIDDGRATEDEMSMQTIRRIYDEDPEYVLNLMSRNDRYVFFEEIAPDGEGDVGGWPRGGMGMVITPMRSVAVDPKWYPPGSILLVVTELATPDGGFEPFTQLMVVQDVGGAIKGSGRADLFIGVGDEAGEIAGRQVSEGVIYPLLLMPDNEDQ